MTIEGLAFTIDQLVKEHLKQIGKLIPYEPLRNEVWLSREDIGLQDSSQFWTRRWHPVKPEELYKTNFRKIPTRRSFRSIKKLPITTRRSFRSRRNQKGRR